MPKITVLPNRELAPSGRMIEVHEGSTICDALLNNGVEIEHPCGKVGACTTCHVVVRKGFSSLPHATDAEENMLDRAWGVEPYSRLSCQAMMVDADLTIEIPQYSLNHAKEGR